MNLSKIMPTMNLRKLKILQSAVNVSGVATGRYGGQMSGKFSSPLFIQMVLEISLNSMGE